MEMLVHCGRQAGSFVSLLGIFGCVYGGRGGIDSRHMGAQL